MATTSPILQHLLLLGLAMVAFSPDRFPAGPPNTAPAQSAPADPFRGPYPDDPDLPPGFADTVIATGITAATAMAVTPDGRLFVCEQTGAVRVIKDDKLLPRPFLTLEVDSYWERGLIGVALDPGFPQKPYVYLCYVTPRPYPHHRVSRFTAQGDIALADSELVLLEGDDQTRLGGFQPGGHQGGGLQFGKDGKLYIGIGDQTAGNPAQRLDTFQGKLLRIDPDGSIPRDNPFYKTTRGKYRAIWALGLRNPFGLAVQPGTGRLLINDVGDARLEEINDGLAGANYGWPESEGPTDNPRHKGPLYAYGRSVGRSITGGTFYNPAVVQFPSEYVGKYFFLDFMDHWIHVLDPDKRDAVSDFAKGLAGPVAIVTGPDGSLYYLNRKEWVKDDQFRPKTGSVHRISYPASTAKPVSRLLEQPDDPTVAIGQPATFRISATGAAPLHYQWFREGKPIPGATSPRHELATVTAADNGARFRCRVSNALGSTKSKPAVLRVLPLHEAASPGHLVPGLDFAYFEGRWEALPDFESLRPARAGPVANLDLSPGVRDEHFGATFRGLLQVDADGVYAFDITACGIAKLFVGSAEVIHVAGLTAAKVASGKLALKAGKHSLMVLYTHGARQPRLELCYSGPDLTPGPIPASQLFRADRSVLRAPTIHPPGGKFSGPVLVRLKTDTAGANIRYTLDGTPPTSTSAIYRQPFVLDRPATVVAKSLRGNESSTEARAPFEITDLAPYGLPYRDLVTTLNVPREPGDLPLLLSQTGIFRALPDLTPNAGIIPYEVNSPLWSDGAAKRRWIALPGDARLGFAPTGEWKFQAGTVFVKQFEIGIDETQPDLRRRLETRLLVVDDSTGYGVTYRWRPDQRDAELLKDGLTEDIPVRTPAGSRMVKWSYPSRSDCLVCHTTNAGFVLGVKTRQLNGAFTYPATGVTDNQLRTWNHLGLFDPPLAEVAIPRYRRLVAITDASATVEHRVRSYLDANCAQCHRPGGTRGLFDARFDTPLSRQNLVGGPLAAADLGGRGASLITPGDPTRSALCARMNRRGDVYAMPPLASGVVDSTAVAVVSEWVKALAPKKRPAAGGPNANSKP